MTLEKERIIIRICGFLHLSCALIWLNLTLSKYDVNVRKDIALVGTAALSGLVSLLWGRRKRILLGSSNFVTLLFWSHPMITSPRLFSNKGLLIITEWCLGCIVFGTGLTAAWLATSPGVNSKMQERHENNDERNAS